MDRSFRRLPTHIGVIPDGNRRWAQARGAPRRDGYPAGIEPGMVLLQVCRDLGIRKLSVYGFTKENVRRPADQVAAFRKACVQFSRQAVDAGVALHVIGDCASEVFPRELRPYARAPREADLQVNLLVNYGWQWDLAELGRTGKLASAGAPRIDLVIRWGGRRRLSGFLPVQCAYADIYVVDTLWPDMRIDELLSALRWYEQQDVTLGG